MPDVAARAMAALDDGMPAYMAQAVPDASAETPADLLPFPIDFNAFIASLMAFKELLLAGALQSQCACDGWSNQHIILRADPAADAVIKQRLRPALKRFKGGELVDITVTVADDGEILSEAEKQRAAYAKVEQAIQQSSDMRRIKSAFPFARITNIDVSGKS